MTTDTTDRIYAFDDPSGARYCAEKHSDWTPATYHLRATGLDRYVCDDHADQYVGQPAPFTRRDVPVGSWSEDDGRRMSMFVDIRWDGRRLSIVGDLKDSKVRRDGGSVAGGQNIRHLDSITDPAPGWEPADIVALKHIWEAWHLNDMRAGCAHQRALGWKVEDKVGVPCPECGYRFGSQWLFEKVPASFIVTLLELADR